MWRYQNIQTELFHFPQKTKTKNRKCVIVQILWTLCSYHFPQNAPGHIHHQSSLHHRSPFPPLGLEFHFFSFMRPQRGREPHAQILCVCECVCVCACVCVSVSVCHNLQLFCTQEVKSDIYLSPYSNVWELNKREWERERKRRKERQK